MLRRICINRKVSFIVTSPPPSPPPPSAHTNHKPTGQSAHQQSLSVVHRVHYLAPFSPRDVSSAVRVCSPPELQVYRAFSFNLSIIFVPANFNIFIILIISMHDSFGVLIRPFGITNIIIEII